MRATPVLVLALLLACNGDKISEPQVAGSAMAPKTNMITPKFSEVSALATAPIHNPRSQAGSVVACFSGTADGDQGGVTYGGTCTRFLPTKDGAELRTNDGDPDGSYAGVYAVPVLVRGKTLGQVNELSFSYAGGEPSGGSPRWSVAIDENGNGLHDADEAYAFADALACNDGDAFVGEEDGEDDASCTWFYESESFPNWDSFAGAHPTYRIARKTATGGFLIPVFMIIDAPAHYLVWKVNVN